MDTVTLSPEDILHLFDQTGAYLKGHFRLTSGLHSSEYLQCALVLSHPVHAERIGADLASRILAATRAVTIDLVAAPAIGGLIIGHETARALGARFIFTERDKDGVMTLRRGFQIEAGESAIVIEDVITTGGSTKEVLAILEAAGAKALAAGCVIDRSGGKADLGVPLASLASLNVKTFPPESCPLCARGVPVVKPGSRK